MKLTRISSLATLAALALTVSITQTGCVSVSSPNSGAGGAAYSMGNLEAHLDASVTRATSATGSALDRLRYSKIAEVADATEAAITARTASDTKITVKLKQTSDKTCSISIRFGALGDKVLSEALLSEIRKEL